MACHGYRLFPLSHICSVNAGWSASECSHRLLGARELRSMVKLLRQAEWFDALELYVSTDDLWTEACSITFL